jgi:hypothetical protein
MYVELHWIIFMKNSRKSFRHNGSALKALISGQRRFKMRQLIIATITLSFLFVSSGYITVVSAEDGIRVSETLRHKNRATTAPSVQTTPAVPAMPGIKAPQSEPTSESFFEQPDYQAGCCQKPTPFPGLHCCDTQDCGWFDCSSVISSDQKVYK